MWYCLADSKPEKGRKAIFNDKPEDDKITYLPGIFYAPYEAYSWYWKYKENEKTYW